MKIIFVNIIKCWGSIEELVPPIIEINEKPAIVINIVKKVLEDRDIPWLNLVNKFKK